MFYRLTSHIHFLFTATNQHGVHSPFVYRYITTCLYQPPHYKFTKSISILFKTIDYFNIKVVQLVGGDREIEKQLSIKGIALTDSESALIYLASLNQTTIEKYASGNLQIMNETIIYVPEIFKNKERNQLWRTLTELESVSVSLDMYHCGLLFFRREQAKEHFKIRV